MASLGIAARRRTARSSSIFPATLLSFLVFCLVLSWGINLFAYNSESSRPVFGATRRAAPEGNMIVNKPDHEAAFVGAGMGSSTNAARQFMPLRVISFNIRYATGSPGISEYPWSVRCPKLCNQVNFITAGHENAFICFQEVLYSQLNDIQAHLGDSWSHIGKGRDNGEKKGEFSPIFFRSDVWACEHHETRWLSETPEKPSTGWDAVLPRIVTMGKFIHRGTGTRVVVMSTHFDHIGVEARKNSAKLLIKFAKEWKVGPSSDASVVLIGGDFNSTPQDGAYRIMTAEESTMADIASVVPLSKHYGNHLTYTSFGEPTEWPQRIDFLFIQKPWTAIVKTFGVLANSFDDQIRVSDHRAVVSDMDIVV